MTAPRLFRRAALAAALATASLGAAAQSVDVEKLCVCWVSSLSETGNAAAGNLVLNGGVMRWTRKDGVKGLGRNLSALGSGGGTPTISADGHVVAATILSSDGTIATQGRWTAEGGWQDLDHPLPPDGGVMDLQDSLTFGMSNDGTVVTGLYWRPGQSGGSAHASVWSAATGMVGMPTAGGSSRIDDANHDGSVLVGWEEDPNTGARQATVWASGVKTTLDTSENGSEAHAINAAGTIIVGQASDPATNQQQAAMWTLAGGTWQKQLLGVWTGVGETGSSYAVAMSNDGQLVGGLYRKKFSIFSSGAFVWTPASGLVDAGHWLQTQGVSIHPEKFQIQQVSAISGDGRVLSFVGQDLVAPYATRTYLVTRHDLAAR